jgi:sulfatase maturation enzyme AslB (radical SAM superfamily)
MQKLEFGLFGGEPLLEWELFRYATEYVEQRAQETDTKLVKTVTTNAVLLYA